MDRFWSKVDKNGPAGCWLWLACRTSDGYGQFRLARKVVRAHRVAYEMLVEPIPDGMDLDHLCRVRSCVNPTHLEPVEPIENTRRGRSFATTNRAKTNCVNGHPFSITNTYVMPDGFRACRACRQEASMRYRKKLAVA